MMTQYHKIQTVFKRDPATKHKTLLLGEWSLPEFGYLAMNDWEFTEKVDGTNIRVIIESDGVRIGGRTDAAQIPAFLMERLHTRFLTDDAQAVLHTNFPDGGVLYGEGYGARIQKGGGNYRPDADFVLFDVRVGDWWLQRADVESAAETLGIDVVPVIGVGALHDMVDKALSGIVSDWGQFTAEGIVARPATELRTRSGHRLITKIKCRDF